MREHHCINMLDNALLCLRSHCHYAFFLGDRGTQEIIYCVLKKKVQCPKKCLLRTRKGKGTKRKGRKGKRKTEKKKKRKRKERKEGNREKDGVKKREGRG